MTDKQDDARPDKSRRERIADAQDAARHRRVELGLPAEPDDGPFSDEAMKGRWGRRKR